MATRPGASRRRPGPGTPVAPGRAVVPVAGVLLLCGAAPGAAAAIPHDAAGVDASARRSDEAVRSGSCTRPWPSGVPSADTLDTFRDEAARELIRLARRARGRVDSTLRSQAVTFRERLYVGVDSDRFRRERALFGQQRAARVAWRRDGDRVVRWLGARRQAPVPDSRVTFDDLDDTFSFLDPGETGLFLGGDWAIHPLADSAGRHYRFRSGDTLRIGLPDLERTVEMAEVLVEPREARSDLVAGSLWFDTETGALARAVYRPARDPEVEDAPRFLRPIDLQVDHVVVEYGLERLRWWRPRRVAFEGTARLTGLFRIPARLEWTFRDYELNRELDLDPGEEIPEGWRRVVRGPSEGGDEGDPDRPQGDGADARGERADAPGDTAGAVAGTPEAGRDTIRTPGGDVAPAADSASEARRTVILVPPLDSLRASPELPEPFGRGAGGVDASDVAALRDRLDRIEVPDAGLPSPSLGLGTGPGLARYNRVEALALGAGVDVPLASRTELDVRALVATASGEPDVRVRLRREGPGDGWGISAYRGLAAAGDHGDPLGIGNSLNALLLGQDDGLYYRRLGGAVAATREGRHTRLSGRLFVERQKSAPPRTDASLPALLGDDRLEGELGAERGVLAGLSGRLRLQDGVDPSSPALSGDLRGELAAGDFDYGRFSASGVLTSPLDRRWVAGAEVRVGAATGNPPEQRGFFLGGPYTLRGFPPGSLRGEGVGSARLEVGRALLQLEGEEAGRMLREAGVRRAGNGGRLLRGVLFADAGWAGDPSGFGRGGPAVSVGAGLSVLDGLLRVDVARAVEDGDDWRVHVYMDGVL